MQDAVARASAAGALAQQLIEEPPSHPQPPSATITAPPLPVTIDKPPVTMPQAPAPPPPPPIVRPPVIQSKIPVVPAPMDKAVGLFISRIPDGISDETMTELLECCGRLTKWRRTSDSTSTPDVPRKTSFGFADFHSTEATLRCRRLLPAVGLKLPRGTQITPSQPLMVVADIKVEEFLQKFAIDHHEYTDYLVQVQTESIANGAPPPEYPRLDQDGYDAKARLMMDEVLTKDLPMVRERQRQRARKARRVVRPRRR